MRRRVSARQQDERGLHDLRGLLAPRDVVARAIVEEMTRNKEEFVYLDLANHYHGPQPIAERFPNIRKACLDIGIDIEKDPIPVVPAAHYFCGGVLVNTF